MKIPFVGDARENITVYLTPPEMVIPENKGGGRKNKLSRPNKKGISIRNYKKSLTKEDYQKIDIRKGSKGILIGDFHKRKVWVLSQKSGIFTHEFINTKESERKHSVCIRLSPYKGHP